MYDIPDYMHVQGLYETTMYTKAYDSIDQKINSMAKAANTQKGKGSFDQTRKKMENTQTDVLSVGVEGWVFIPII